MDKNTAVNVTIRAVELARRAAGAGRVDLARRAWLLACYTCGKCGGLSGTTEGRAFILVDRGWNRHGNPKADYVAYAPIGVIR